MAAASSMAAMSFSCPPQCGQRSMSISNTRFNNCAQRMRPFALSTGRWARIPQTRNASNSSVTNVGRPDPPVCVSTKARKGLRCECTSVILPRGPAAAAIAKSAIYRFLTDASRSKNICRYRLAEYIQSRSSCVHVAAIRLSSNKTNSSKEYT